MNSKLKEKGVVGKLLAMLHTFQKIAFVWIDEHDTSEIKIETGFPHGSASYTFMTS